MEKVFQELMFGLVGLKEDDPYSVFFSSYSMADISRQLGELGYKNTDLLPFWFAKIDAMLSDVRVEQTSDFDSAVYGGMKNFVPRHYIYRGFEENEEFKEHMQTLLEWQTDPSRSAHMTPVDDKEVQEIELAMTRVIEAANQIKKLQVDQQAAIDNVRLQYFKLQ